MAAVVLLLLLVLLPRESAAVLEPVCLDCKGQVNCDVVASTGDLVCRLPDSCATRKAGLGAGCRIVPGNGHRCIAIYLLSVTNSSTLLNYTAGTFCRDSASNVTNTSLCYYGTENGNLCQCDTDRCNNQVVFPGFTTPMPTTSTGDPTPMTPNLTGMPAEWLLYGKTLVCIIIIPFTLTHSLSQSLSSWHCLSCYFWFYLSL